VSIQDLRPNSQDLPAFYLKNIYQAFANSSVSPGFIPPPLVEPEFTAPSYAIWVNSLWFLSLCVSLSVATVATLGQQWARRYITVTQQPRCSPDKRARIRAVFAKRAQAAYIILGAGRLPFYLHISLSLFTIGGIIYLYNINRAVSVAVIFWVAINIIAYSLVTLEAIFKTGVLFYTPLSQLVLHIYLIMSAAVLQVCSYLAPLHDLCDRLKSHYRDLSERYRGGFLEGKWKATEITASKRSSEIDAHVLVWTFECSCEDDALEGFFEAIPGFYNSKLVKDVEGHLPDEFRIKFGQAMSGFLDRTFSVHSVSGPVRSSRLVACLNAARAALGSNAVSSLLYDVLNGRWAEALQSVEVGHALRHWGHSKNHYIDLIVRRIVSCIIARARRRDKDWIALVKDEFGIPRHVIQNYFTHGDSMSLAILIHITRQLLHSDFPLWNPDILRALSHVDVCKALPGLQGDFCALWNEIVQEARKRGTGSTPTLILKEIRHVYLAFHQGTDSAPTAYTDLTGDSSPILSEPLSYPSCGVVGHHPDSTPRTQKVSVGNTTRTLATRSHIHDAPGAPPFPTPMSASPHPTLRKGESPLVVLPGVAAAVASQSTTDTSAVSSTAHPIRFPTPSGVPAVRQIEVEETEIHRSSVVFGSPTVPFPMPVMSSSSSSSSNAIPAVVHSSIDYTVARIDYIPHTSGIPPSSSPTASVYHDASEPNPPIPMEVFHHPPQSAPSYPDLVTADVMRHEGHQHDKNDT